LSLLALLAASCYRPVNPQPISTVASFSGKTAFKLMLPQSGMYELTAAELRALAGDANMGNALSPALDLFESRNGFLAARDIDLKRVSFSTSFGRGFDYYTGFVFELTDPARTGDPLVAGGRYDGLLARLGASEPIAAVGFAVWIERLAAYGASS